MEVYCINYISEEYGEPRTLLKICSTLEKAEEWLDNHVHELCNDMEDDWYWDERSHYEIVEEEVD